MPTPHSRSLAQRAPCHHVDQLVDEHRALMRHYGEAQVRCSELVRTQASDIERLRGEAMRLRAAVIVRDTALAWAHEQRALLEAAVPGLPRRMGLARRVEALLVRIQELIRERLHRPRAGSPHDAVITGALIIQAGGAGASAPAQEERAEDMADLEASLVAADLVICQTGCLSHGAYWRVQDHCKRTGKACVLVEQPDALRIVRIHKPSPCDGSAATASMTERELA